MPFETERIEFKEIFVNDIYKEVIAFANTDGGTIYVGVKNDGQAIGLKDIDETYARITNGIRDAILPDVTIFVKYILEDNQIIRIEVGEGSFKPYYLKSKGLKSSGVYVRQGATSVQASPEQIRQMIKSADGDVYEDLRSPEQNLTFQTAKDAFADWNITLTEEKFYVLGIRNKAQGLYTNLGMILSDQCAHTIKVAVFADDKKTVFRDHKEFIGSIFQQLEETFAYLQLNNKNKSIIDGVKRTDFWDYPKEAIREALLNSLIHRDYSYSGSIIINVNESGMEFISIGGLLYGLTPEDIRNGISQLRNRKLANVFHRLNYIESYGTGIRRIFALYESCIEQPQITVTPNTFKISLPNMNQTRQTVVDNQKEYIKITPQMKTVLDYLSEHGQILDIEMQKLLDIKRTRAYILSKQMSDAGLIKIVGRGEDRKYVPIV